MERRGPAIEPREIKQVDDFSVSIVWGDERHCYSGLWGYADDNGHREIYEPLAEELAHQQTLWEAQRRDHRAVEETVNIDKIDEAARQVDVAATRSRTKRRE